MCSSNIAEGRKLIRLTRSYRFAASHRLNVPQYTSEQNQELFGKCNNPHGHGHNYLVQITVEGPIDPQTGLVVDPAAMDRLVTAEVVNHFDHRYINEDLPEFKTRMASTEVIGEVMEERLLAVWPASFPRLKEIQILETKRNSFRFVSSQ